MAEMDDNVHPASAMRLADALIRTDKTFDMLMLRGEPRADRSRRAVRRREQLSAAAALVLLHGTSGSAKTYALGTCLIRRRGVHRRSTIPPNEGWLPTRTETSIGRMNSWQAASNIVDSAMATVSRDYLSRRYCGDVQ